MTELSSPTLTFAIPSLADDVLLDCRIYHPQCSIPQPPRLIKAAVIAHPYAPLGGCQDDPIVLCLVNLLLAQDYILGTFNFRGASPSSGHTSWTAKPETQDYISFTGLMAYYLHHVGEQTGSSNGSVTASLLLAGYSYGALITTLLPSPSASSPSIFDPLVSPSPGTAAHTIRSRAQHLASTYMSSVSSPEDRSPGRGRSPEKSLQIPRQTRVVVGSAETSPGISGSRRSGEDQRRSLDTVRLRQSVEKAREKLHQHLSPSGHDNLGHENANVDSYDPDMRPTSSRKSQEDEKNKSGSTSIETLLPPRLNYGYLLVSPPVGSLASLATMFSASTMRAGEQKFLTSPTLVVYGDEDGFTGQKRYRRWCEDLNEQAKSVAKHENAFQLEEIEGAGHFWRERGVEVQMREVVRTWIQKLNEVGGE